MEFEDSDLNLSDDDEPKEKNVKSKKLGKVEKLDLDSDSEVGSDLEADGPLEEDQDSMDRVFIDQNHQLYGFDYNL